jgi:serine/threonine protein kinase
MSSLIGRKLLDTYRVDEFIASTRTSVVYKAWHLQGNVPLAIKVLRMDLTEDPSAIKLFQREARALEKLSHPNIVPFYGLYQSSLGLFLVEKYIDGATLKDIIRKRDNKTFSINETLVFLKVICTALNYAHNYGVVHCDIKPGNIMVDRSGKIFLADFGVARHAESTTTTIGAAGTPAYMAPEQIRGDMVSVGTDIYSLGVMVFEMMTGRRPFTGGETESQSSGTTAAERVRSAHIASTPPDPRSINPQISEPVSRIILRCLEKNPENRYSSSIEFLDAICDSAGIAQNNIDDRIPLNLLDFRESNESKTKSFLKKIPVWVSISGMILLISCILLTGFGLAKGINSLTSITSETPTIVITNTQEFIPSKTIQSSPSLTNRPIPTKTIIPTNTNLPTKQPTYTPRPTFTAAPTNTQAAQNSRVTLHNKRSVTIRVFINGIDKGTIQGNRYMWVELYGENSLIIEWCNEYGLDCKTKTFSTDIKDINLN